MTVDTVEVYVVGTTTPFETLRVTDFEIGEGQISFELDPAHHPDYEVVQYPVTGFHFKVRREV